VHDDHKRHVEVVRERRDKRAQGVQGSGRAADGD
jgi:hypothetical protein